MAKRRVGIIAFLLCFCLCLMPQYALAASTTDANEPIDTGRPCTLTIGYTYDGTAFPNQTVTLYHVADVSADFQYTLTAPFAPSNLVLNGIQTNGEWDVIRTTMESYILSHGVTPTATAVTDELGQAHFTGLKPGLYFASPVTVVRNGQTCVFDPALTSLPGLDNDGLWQYDIAIAAKPGLLPPITPDETRQFKVLKLWKGDEDRSDRPQDVEVQILRNGVLVETVTLSEDNHWSHSWTAKADGASWNVAEKNVPTGYTMTVEDLITGRTFPDSIALSGYGWDLPNPKKPSDQPFHKVVRKSLITQIPYGTLLPQGINNLITVGRCISVEREVLGPVRVMGPCIAMGEAAGIATALALTGNTSYNKVDTAVLREKIVERGGMVDPEQVKFCQTI